MRRESLHVTAIEWYISLAGAVCGAAGPGWFEKMQRNGVMECSVCHSKVVAGTPRSISRAYDKHKSKISSKQRVLNFLLVSGDCVLVGLQVFHSQYDIWLHVQSTPVWMGLNVAYVYWKNVTRQWESESMLCASSDRVWLCLSSSNLCLLVLPICRRFFFWISQTWLPSVDFML